MTTAENESMREVVLNRAVALVEFARECGMVLTIETNARQPLAMGHFDMVVGVRPARAKADAMQKPEPWLGCGECDCEFTCHNGKTTCIREPIYVALDITPPQRQPLTQCWKCGDMDAEFQAKCNVPACGMKEGKTP